MNRRLPLLLASLCAAAGLLAQPDTALWRTFINTGDLTKASEALTYVKEVNGRLEPGAANRADARKLEDLLFSKSEHFTDAELLGAWKCRSIQVGSLGVFSYPQFPLRIAADQGRLRLEKIGGSQLRRGYLYGDGPNHRRIFLGKQFVRGEDPKTDYSGLAQKGEGEGLKDDSVGVLVKKAKGRFVLILDATSTSYEVYELTR